MKEVTKYIEKLKKEHGLTREEWIFLLRESTEETDRILREEARAVSLSVFGRRIYARGLIEFTSFCRNDCYYCGLRKSRKEAVRYRLTEEEILRCCEEGHALGFGTFVLQGGEDPWWDGDRMTELIRKIRAAYPETAVTLSVGEQPREVYQKWFDAGADRYLLRHETADPRHYRKLHPEEMSSENRKSCLCALRDIGYQVGTGFMVGSPGQGPEELAEDFLFITELRPHMIGIGPFVPHHGTPFAEEKGGTAALTLRCISLLRLLSPKALLPATTALGTIDPAGREKGILAGANVVMPNLSPKDVRKQYDIYDNKLSTGDEAAEAVADLKTRFEKIGYELTQGRGDHPDRSKRNSSCTM